MIGSRPILAGDNPSGSGLKYEFFPGTCFAIIMTMKMKMKQLLIPNDRLSISEHIQMFCDISNFPMEIYVGREAHIVYQHEVYNLLLKGQTFAIDSSLMTSLVQFRDDERLPEFGGEMVVIDHYNCFVKQGEYWYPYRFHFVSESRSCQFFSKGGFAPDLEHPIKWNTLLRFLKTFHPYRRKFALYHTYLPMENYYSYLKSLYVEFKSIPSNELETMGDSRRTRIRVRDELVRRRVLSYRV